MNIKKVILFSALVSANMVVWYDVLGMDLFIALAGFLILFMWKRRFYK